MSKTGNSISISDVIRKGGVCEGREGILEINECGKWSSFCYRDMGATTPVVCKCACEALHMLQEVLGPMLGAVVDGDIDVRSIPLPKDFRYTYVDVEPEEMEVTSTEDAALALAKVMEISK